MNERRSGHASKTSLPLLYGTDLSSPLLLGRVIGLGAGPPRFRSGALEKFQGVLPQHDGHSQPCHKRMKHRNTNMTALGSYVGYFLVVRRHLAQTAMVVVNESDLRCNRFSHFLQGAMGRRVAKAWHVEGLYHVGLKLPRGYVLYSGMHSLGLRNKFRPGQYGQCGSVSAILVGIVLRFGILMSGPQLVLAFATNP